jgi:hypothetical protein
MSKRQKLKSDISIKDLSDPTSVVNKADPKIRDYILTIPDKFLGCTEHWLVKRAEPDDKLWALRISFAKEYAKVKDKPPNKDGCPMLMQMVNVYSGICFKEYMAQSIYPFPEKMAFVITPPLSYRKTQEMALTQGMRRVREMLDIPLKKKITKTTTLKNGKTTTEVREEIDHRAIAELRNTLKWLDDRQQGAIAQKLEIQQMALIKGEISSRQQVLPTDELSMTAIEDKMRELKQLEAGGVADMPTIDVELEKEELEFAPFKAD